jgi:hypothetical protein
MDSEKGAKISSAQAATIMGISVRTLEGWRPDYGPPFYRTNRNGVTGSVWYWRHEVIEWREEHMRVETSNS